MCADEVLGKVHAALHGKRDLAVDVHEVAGRDGREAVLIERLEVFLGGVAAAGVGGVAFDDGAVERGH